MQNKQDELKVLEGTIFELKLKLIDQSHETEEGVK
jgi:hypothetical protein